jgi:uncharacterized protein (TIGR03032 family)
MTLIGKSNSKRSDGNMQPSAKLSVQASKGLGDWLHEQSLSLVVSAYQTGQLITIGSNEKGKIQLRSIRFDRSMGLARDDAGFWVATFNRIWRFGFLPGSAAKGGKHDAYLVPQVSLMTGYVNAHDLAIAARGQPVFAASMFNCIATTNNNTSFTPVWYPPFITDRAPRDACHLNGIALDKGKLRFATVLTQSNEPGAWRKDLAGGAIFDVSSNAAVVENLAQPHSPRIHKGRLWLHESGKGVFGTIDKGRFAEIIRCPGYARGLSFHGDVACMGVSKPRAANAGGAALLDSLKAQNIEANCGLVLVDLKTGKVIHSLRFGDGIDEIFDVALLGFRDPLLIDPSSDLASKTYLLGKGAK